MSLCILTSSYPANPGDSNNAGVFVRDFARACEAFSSGCTVFTHRKGTPGDYRDKFSVIEYGWMGKDSSLTSVNLRSIAGMIKACSLLLKGSLGYIRLCRRGQISHSLAMWAFPSGFYAWLAKKLYGVPYSVWALGSDIWRYEKHPLIGPLLRMVLRNADHLFADGMEFAETVAAISGRECSFLPSTRSLGKIEALPVNNQSPRPRFLYVGRYEYNKGPDILLEAAREYFARGGCGSFHLFGEGSFRKQMDSYVSDHAMATGVAIHDVIGAEELVGRLQWCDYLIIPSRIESIPVILSDAIQLGTPIIATEVGDIPAICMDLHSATTVPPEEPLKLAEALLNCVGQDRKNVNYSSSLLTPLTPPIETAGKFLHCAGLLKGGYQDEFQSGVADY
jgi:glycosyltransferase involved in cell wall biosynthesis